MTLFDIAVVRFILRPFSIALLRLMGWSIFGLGISFPKKGVVLAYPHTGGVDLFYTVLLSFALSLRPRVVAKKELFFFPLAIFLRFLGCIPVDRKNPQGAVDDFTGELKGTETVHLVIAATGTRNKDAEWKTGPIRIAHGASVPILLATVRRRARQGGIFGEFYTSGDAKRDLEVLKRKYAECDEER